MCLSCHDARETPGVASLFKDMEKVSHYLLDAAFTRYKQIWEGWSSRGTAWDSIPRFRRAED